MSIGIILHIMPSLVISQVILHIIGIMPMPIIGIIIGMPMPGIMPFIIMGFIMPIIGFIMPMPIMGFIIGIPIVGIPCIAFIIGVPMLELFIGIAFIMLVHASYVPAVAAQARHLPPRRFPLFARRSVSIARTGIRRGGLGAVIADELDGPGPRLGARACVENLRSLVVTERVLRVVHV